MTTIFGGPSELTDGIHTSSGQSKVRIQTSSDLTTARPFTIAEDDRRSLGYVLCSQTLGPNGGSLLQAGLQFNISICVSGDLTETQRRSVTQALSAWLHIGGIGARTNRGLGKLELVSQSADAEDLLWCSPYLELPENPNNNGCQPSNLPWQRENPDHRTWLFPKWKHSDATVALKRLLLQYQTYRQARKSPVTGRPHRSFWPDADSIRKLSNNKGHHPIQHSAVLNGASPFSKLFFGAPVIIDFGPRQVENGDPEFSTLNFMIQSGGIIKPAERFSSPIVFSVVKVQEKNITVFCPSMTVLPYTSDLDNRCLHVSNPGINVPSQTLTRQQYWPANQAQRKEIFSDAFLNTRYDNSAPQNWDQIRQPHQPIRNENRNLAQSLNSAANYVSDDPIKHFERWIISRL
jgi:hypothetical protein